MEGQLGLSELSVIAIMGVRFSGVSVKRGSLIVFLQQEVSQIYSILVRWSASIQNKTKQTNKKKQPIITTSRCSKTVFAHEVPVSQLVVSCSTMCCIRLLTTYTVWVA